MPREHLQTRRQGSQRGRGQPLSSQGTLRDIKKRWGVVVLLAHVGSAAACMRPTCMQGLPVHVAACPPKQDSLRRK